MQFLPICRIFSKRFNKNLYQNKSERATFCFRIVPVCLRQQNRKYRVTFDWYCEKSICRTALMFLLSFKLLKCVESSNRRISLICLYPIQGRLKFPKKCRRWLLYSLLHRAKSMSYSALKLVSLDAVSFDYISIRKYYLGVIKK